MLNVSGFPMKVFVKGFIMKWILESDQMNLKIHAHSFKLDATYTRIYSL